MAQTRDKREHGGYAQWTTENFDTQFVVVAPEHSGWLVKKGFRWRKLWKRRWIYLSGRYLCYSSESPVNSDEAPDDASATLVWITSSTIIETDDVEGHPHGFTIRPTSDAFPWHLRAENIEDKDYWLAKLFRCRSIAAWLENFERRQVLGVGGNGIVREYADKRVVGMIKTQATNQLASMYGQNSNSRNYGRVAIKEIEVKSRSHMHHALREVEVLQSVSTTINHPNLISIYKVFQEGRKLSFFFQLCTGGELYDRVVRKGRYSERDASEIMRKIVSALAALHEHNILHLDIKPENVLFESEDDDAELKITDFGLARFATSTSSSSSSSPKVLLSTPSFESSTSKPGASNESEINMFDAGIIQKERLCGTVGYMAPEVIIHRTYSAAADVWASGIILYILLVGYPPFHSYSDREVLEKSARGEYVMRDKDWNGVSNMAKDLVRRMLEVDPVKRISVDGVLSHEWIVSNEDLISDLPLQATKRRMTTYNSVRRSQKVSTTLSAVQGQLRQAAASLGLESVFDQQSSSNRVSPLLHGDMQAKIHLLFKLLSGGSELNHAPLLNEVGKEWAAAGGSDGATSSIEKATDRQANDETHSTSPSPPDDDDATGLRTRSSSGLYNQSSSEDSITAAASSSSGGWNPGDGKLNLEQFSSVLDALVSMTSSSTSPASPIVSSLRRPLLFKFFDRDQDGFVSSDDFIETHTIIVTRAEPFMRAVFRLYLESVWYPGKGLNRAARVLKHLVGNALTTSIKSHDDNNHRAGSTSIDGNEASDSTGGVGKAIMGLLSPFSSLPVTMSKLSSVIKTNRKDADVVLEVDHLHDAMSSMLGNSVQTPMKTRPVDVDDDDDDTQTGFAGHVDLLVLSAVEDTPGVGTGDDGATLKQHAATVLSETPNHSSSSSSTGSHVMPMSGTSGLPVMKTGDVVMPPTYVSLDDDDDVRFITCKNVGGLFSTLGYEYSAGERLFNLVFDAIVAASSSGLAPPELIDGNRQQQKGNSLIDGDAVSHRHMSFELFLRAVDLCPVRS